MRFRSRSAAGGRVYAVTGVNTVSFAIDAGPATAQGLLGFAVERIDDVEGERYYMAGFKVFPSVVPVPRPGLQVSTYDHPVQSLVWDDFTAKPDREYRYLFHPLKGQPKHIDRRSRALTIRIRTEPLVQPADGRAGHDVFFNRGVASSQAYERRFGVEPIEQLEPAVRDAALHWLSRDLGDALLRFVDACPPGDGLLGCFYEFRYRPAAEALRRAVERGVDVRLVIDGKDNSRTDGDGVFHESFPRQANMALLSDVGFPPERVVLREARPSAIQHNKFMVRLAAGTQPREVWTGSTNLSVGGISGQTNVGHWVRDVAVAEHFERYWRLLAGDPGGRADDAAGPKRTANAALRAAVAELSPVPVDLRAVPRGTTVVFSPRPDDTVLSGYAALLDTAERLGCITLAFGVSTVFKDLLRDNTPHDHLVFMLLEKRDRPRPGSEASFVRINASNNVYQAWGSYLEDPVYQWAKETNAGLLGLNSHVSYVHSKFMLIDPLGADPMVITGSANFSVDSTKENDENMLIVRGDQRVADIYLTEFNRLFNHYYFRSVTEATRRARPASADPGAAPGEPSLFLDETDGWLHKYAPGTLRAKRLRLYVEMAGFTRT